MPGLADYAGWLYARPGMQTLLLALQDEAGQDVLLLLTACWLGQRRVVADERLWLSLQESQTRWRARVILPLRQVRRALADNAAAHALYEQVKACELAAEWHQLAVLEQLCQSAATADGSSQDYTLAHLQLSGADTRDARIQQLAMAALQTQP
ncbi:MAG: TIGR02444 family protein [Pseudomonas sp.]